jgi:hypothetical protein
MGRKRPTPPAFFTLGQKRLPVHLTMSGICWNFNIENKLGVGWLACGLSSITFLFATAGNRRSLYGWADEWVLADEENVR